MTSEYPPLHEHSEPESRREVHLYPMSIRAIVDAAITAGRIKPLFTADFARQWAKNQAVGTDFNFMFNTLQRIAHMQRSEISPMYRVEVCQVIDMFERCHAVTVYGALFYDWEDDKPGPVLLFSATADATSCLIVRH